MKTTKLMLIAGLLSLLAGAAAQGQGTWSTAHLSEPRDWLAAASVGHYALFAGGVGHNGLSNTVDLFDSTTGQWSTASLSQPRCYLTATAVGKYALFAGGLMLGGESNAVDIFDSTTGQWSTATLSEGRDTMAATSVGNYALFGGGYINGHFSNTVDIFNAATGQWSVSQLSEARDGLAATTVGVYALFGGGHGVGGVTSTVNAFNSTTGEWVTVVLTAGREALSATTVGHLALFGGGVDSTGAGSSMVDIFDGATGQQGATALSQARAYLAATSVGSYALFGGGMTDPVLFTPSARVDIFNSISGQWSTSSLSVARMSLAATSVGNYALFAGGDDHQSFLDTVDIYTISPPTVTITSPTSTYNALVGSTVTLVAAASATSSGGSIAGVKFYDADIVIGTGVYDSGTHTWTYAWNTTGATPGRCDIYAAATDNLGVQAVSSPVTTINLYVPVGPTVAITAPTDGLICGRGWLLALTASTTNGMPGNVTSVEFFDNGAKIAGANGVLAGSVWTYQWNMAAVSIGTHTLTAKATDSYGLTGTWGAVTLHVRMPADGNGDMVVDGEDYGVWQNGYMMPNARFASGDYNGDGIVDGEDYGIWQNNYNATLPTAAATDATQQAASASTPMAAMAPASSGNAPRLIAMTPASGATVAGVTSLALTFDSDVQIGAGAVEISGLSGGNRAGFVIVYDAATRTATLTFAAALPADVYTVRVVADLVVGAGGGAPLDGETGSPAAATLPSGDGQPGGDARIEFTAK